MTFLTGVLIAFVQAAPAASNYVVRATASGGLYGFNPSGIMIAVGDTIIWTNAHPGATHDSTAGPPDSGTNNGWASQSLVFGSGQTFPFTFSSPGLYPYRCRQHADFNLGNYHPEQTGSVTVVTMNLAPIVSLTNPAAGAGFVAPTAINLQADASDTDGTVTNVQFLVDGSPLGSVSMPPFELLTASLSAGNYSFSAVATDDGGLSATSAPVSVFLLTNAVLTNFVFSNGTAHLTVLGIAGQTYFFDATTNLSNWLPFATSVAPSAVFQVMDSNAAAFPHRSYRGRQTAP